MIGISENIPATSEDFQTLPKIMSEDVPTTFENFRSYKKGDIFGVVV